MSNEKKDPQAEEFVEVKPGVFEPKAKVEAVKQSRRDALKMIGGGLLGAFVGKYAWDKFTSTGFKDVPVAYATGVDDAPRVLTQVNGAATLGDKVADDQTVHKLVVDGYVPEGKAGAAIDVRRSVNDIYLNQAMLAGVTGITVSRDAEAEQGETTMVYNNSYTVEFHDGHNKTLLSIHYGPYQTLVNEMDRGAGDGQDRFPNIHFFNDKGKVIDFGIKGDALVARMPVLTVNDIDTENGTELVAEPHHSYQPNSALLAPYLGQREAARSDATVRAAFETDRHPKPLASQHVKTAFNTLAGEVGAPLIEQEKGQKR